MPYSTIDTITKKIDQTILVQLLNDEMRSEADIDLEDENDLVVQRFNEAASAAQAEMDPYFRHRYTLPFESTPDRVVDLSDDITIYNCYKRRGNIPEDRRNNYKDAIKALQDISAGKADLGIEDEPQNLSNEITTNKTSSDKVFNNDDVWDKY